MGLHRYIGRLCIACSLAALAGGCGGNENLSEVSGTVRLDGEPLNDALVVYSPTSGGTTAYGRTDESGRYRMYFKDDEPGAWLGENRVRISTGDVGATGGAGKPERVPDVYNVKSDLTVEVKPGENTFDFELKSDAGELIQPPAE